MTQHSSGGFSKGFQNFTQSFLAALMIGLVVFCLVNIFNGNRSKIDTWVQEKKKIKSENSEIVVQDVERLEKKGKDIFKNLKTTSDSLKNWVKEDAENYRNKRKGKYPSLTTETNTNPIDSSNDTLIPSPETNLEISDNTTQPIAVSPPNAEVPTTFLNTTPNISEPYQFPRIYTFQLGLTLNDKIQLNKFQNLNNLGKLTLETQKNTELKRVLLTAALANKEQAQIVLKEIKNRGIKDAFIANVSDPIDTPKPNPKTVNASYIKNKKSDILINEQKKQAEKLKKSTLLEIKDTPNSNPKAKNNNENKKDKEETKNNTSSNKKSEESCSTSFHIQIEALYKQPNIDKYNKFEKLAKISVQFDKKDHKYRVLLGSFKNKPLVDTALSKVKQNYPNAFIIKGCL